MSPSNHVRFSYQGLVRYHEADCIFGISSNLTALAERIEKLKFLIPITIKRSGEISSSEDEFDLEFHEIPYKD